MKKVNGEPKIEKGVPIPVGHMSGLASLLGKMKVGDSVVMPDTAQERNNFYQTARRLGMAVVIRRDGDSMRIWRTEPKATK